jgi:adenylate cyclase
MARRLAAILAADVAGYSRLMGVDEAGTLAALKAHRQELIGPQVAKRGGRVVGTAGDSFLVEFASVIDAVDCAVAIQDGMAIRNFNLPDDRKMLLRMGVNLGDVIVEGDDIYGDGVNIAARLEGQAEPGGICISSKVYEEVRDKVDAAFEDMGERKVKNILQPVRVYRWAEAAGDRIPSRANPDDALPDKPSIAVLPFTNMSGDPEQEYFSDGITEDIITELSRFRSLFVIARNSSFAYKGHAVNVGRIGKELGVAYVVEGSVRKAGNRMRITAQLVETSTGNHIWAERYDRELEDIFLVQDEVAKEIVTAVPGYVDIASRIQVAKKPVNDLNAYDLMLQAESIWHQDWSSFQVKELLEKALELEPRYARAHGRLASFFAYCVFSHHFPAEKARTLARLHADKALELDPNDPAIHATTAEAYCLIGDHDAARTHIAKAITLNPNDYYVMVVGQMLSYLGDHTEGLRWARLAARHDPYLSDAIREGYFDSYYMAGQYEQAIEQTRGWRKPPAHIYAGMAAAHAMLGRMDEAQALRRQYENNLSEGFGFSDFLSAQLTLCARQEDREKWLEGFRKAGFDA